MFCQSPQNAELCELPGTREWVLQRGTCAENAAFHTERPARGEKYSTLSANGARFCPHYNYAVSYSDHCRSGIKTVVKKMAPASGQNARVLFTQLQNVARAPGMLAEFSSGRMIFYYFFLATFQRIEPRLVLLDLDFFLGHFQKGNLQKSSRF